MLNAKDVLSQLRNRGEIGGTCLLILVEVVVRIQVVVAEEFPGLAMKFLRTALQSKAECGSGSNTVIRRIVAGQHLELRNGVHRRHHAHTAGAAAVIRLGAIQQPDVMALAQAVHADTCAGSRSRWRVIVRQVGADAQAESRQCRKVAVFRRNRGNLLAADQRADFIGFRLYLQRIRRRP